MNRSYSDLDYFMFDVPSTGLYSISLSHKQGNGNHYINIFNNSQTSIFDAKIDSGKASDITNKISLSRGRNYIRITTGANGWETSNSDTYSFSINRYVAPVHVHTPVKVKGYAATSGSTGMTDGMKCSVCGKWITPQRIIPKLVLSKRNQKVTKHTKTAKVKYSKVKKKKQIIKRNKYLFISGTVGKLTFKKLSGSGRLKVSRNGNIIVKKGTKKGKYRMRISIRSNGNAQYSPWGDSVSVCIKIR